MKLSQLRLRNFRGYKEEISVDFDDVTALVGRNDVGKSSIMDALDIFFNDSAPDKDDGSKTGHPADMAIICVFSELPEHLILDQSASTSLEQEYLLNGNNQLEVHKIFNGNLAKPGLTALNLVANHPTADKVSDLMVLTNVQLKQRAQDVGADMDRVDKTVNAQLRQLIRDTVGDLGLRSVDVPLNQGNAQQVWKGIQAHLPAFALFKSDRPSTDQDAEAQDPLNAAIKSALRQKQAELDAIATFVQDEVKKVADLTLEKIREMDPNLASTLTPQFPSTKWNNSFKASIVGDENIPINKRGSGVRRLVLLNFFRAKAELLLEENQRHNVIYAIEEPETSQHPRNQRLLVGAIQELAGRDQVIITTHTPMLARAIPARSIRFIQARDDGTKEIILGGTDANNRLIAKSLGVLPDNTVKLFIGVEGKNDIAFLKNLSRILIAGGQDVPDLGLLEVNGELIFTPFGGQNLSLWHNRLENLNRPEFHLYDRDTLPTEPPKYQQHMDEVNRRQRCRAVATAKREAENYIHYAAINQALAKEGIPAPVLSGQLDDYDNVPKLLRDKINAVVSPGNLWGEQRVKEFLCTRAILNMTTTMLDEIDPQREVLEWFQIIRQMIHDND